MSLEDPFIIVQNEVFDALLKLRNNFTRWTELQENPNELSKDDYSSNIIELKNGIRSIQWDLDELEESLENSERVAKLDINELQKRKIFVEQTKEEVKLMNERLQNNSKLKKTDFQINIGSQPVQNGTKYHRLINAPEASIQTDVLKTNFDTDDEHKSPYAQDHSITFENNGIRTINSSNYKLTRLNMFLNRAVKNWLIIGSVTTIVILLIIMLI